MYLQFGNPKWEIKKNAELLLQNQIDEEES